MSWDETIAISIATLLGPLVAVQITRKLDNKREKRDRRMHIFRTLMSTRRSVLDAQHVGALNLIEVEFSNNPNILNAWRDMSRHLATDANLNLQTWNAQLEKLRGTLLAKIGSTLGYDVSDIETFNGGYAPKAWDDIQTDIRIGINFLRRLAQGETKLPVSISVEKAEDQNVKTP